MPMPDTIDLRCSTIVYQGQCVLLVHRTDPDLNDWVLPGGAPRHGEGMAACARRELREETGLAAEPTRIAFVLEAVDPAGTRRTVDLVFAVEERVQGQVVAREAGLEPEFVTVARLRDLDIRPPLAGHLAGHFNGGVRRYAPYLGNLWRPTGAATRLAISQLPSTDPA